MHPVLFRLGSVFVPAYGALAAIGVLLALLLTQRTARSAGMDPNRVWNLCIVILFTALIGSRVLLIVVNWSILRRHPMWILGLAMIHHPVLATAGATLALLAGWVYARRNHMPLRTTADVLAAPLALGLAFEQIGALLAGSGYGTGTRLPWAVVYTSPLAARWSGVPIGIPVHPVQAYVALAFLGIALCGLLWLQHRRQHGDAAGLCLMTAGVALFITEFWRDPVGRGAMLGGLLRGPQVAAIILVFTGALLLVERKSQRVHRSPFLAPQPSQTGPKETLHG